MKQVEFFFDVGSTYTYLAWAELPRICARTGAKLDWRPMLLGAVFKATGNHSPAEVAAKGRWAGVDIARWARRYGVPFRMNPNFPINTLALMRGATGMLARGEAELQRYLGVVMDAMWVNPRNLNDPAELAAVLGAAGYDAADFMAMIGSDKVKDALKANTEEAIARGVFGAPTFFVGDEMYWGNDRLVFVEEALSAA
jgi:2-hydroxychromene-2-carboxylate isomerase